MCSMRLNGCMEKRDENVKRQKEKKPETHICYLCGKLIEPEEKYVYIRTRRRTEMYIRRVCIPTGKPDRQEEGK